MIWLNESIQSSRKQDPPLSEQIKNCFIFLDRAEALVGDDDPVHFYACASNNLHDNTKLSNNVPFSKKTDSVLKATCVHSLHVMHAARACENIPGSWSGDFSPWSASGTWLLCVLTHGWSFASTLTELR
jgi:hypothetical protein